jgi:hypothetical protein
MPALRRQGEEVELLSSNGKRKSQNIKSTQEAHLLHHRTILPEGRRSGQRRR